MDPLTYAALCQAEKHLQNARQYAGATDYRAKAKEFTELAKCIARARSEENAMNFLHAQQKAVGHVTLDSIWLDNDIQQMAKSFIASTAEPDLLIAIAKYGRPIPRFAGRVLIASGATGDSTAEGFPTLIKNLDLNVGVNTDFVKSLAAVVVSQELLSVGGDAGQKLFEGELAKAVIRAANSAVIASLTDSNTISASAGTDPLASLRAGIRAAGASDGYVVSMPAGDVAWLATHEANRGGMGVRGGTFVPGVEVVALDDATQTVVIPASKLAFIDGGIELRPTDAASVNMADSPTSPSQLVSLWQTNCVGLLVARYWRLDGDTSGIVVVG